MKTLNLLRRTNVVLGLFLILVTIVALYGLFVIPDNGSVGDPGPRSYPLVVIALLGLCAVILTVSRPVRTADDSEEEERVEIKALLPIVVALGLYVVLLEPLGYLLPTVVFTFAALWLAGIRRVLTLVLYTIAVPALIYVVFTQLLGVSLPRGIVEYFL